MKFIARAICILLIISATLSLAGCDSSVSGQINFEINTMPTTVDPQLAFSESELLIVRNIYEGLMRKNIDGEIVCAAAQSYTKSGNTYTFTLRDDIYWSDGSKITAADFVFALQRGVDPANNAPFAKYLECINGASDILSSQSNASSLGVIATDERTLKITLANDSDMFLEILTSPICMPCNEEFFKNTYGKYGMDLESTLSNGSYYLRRWNTENDKITISKSKYYAGDFQAKTGAVVLSIDDDDTLSERLLENDIDGVFLNEYAELENALDNYNSTYFSNTVWALAISNELPNDIRDALYYSANLSALKQLNNSYYEYTDILLPQNSEENIISAIKASQSTSADLPDVKALFSNAVKTEYNGKFPSVSILYYDNEHFKNAATALASHWQNELGAFINIEAVGSTESLKSLYKTKSFKLAIVPFSSERPGAYSFYSQFSKAGANSLNNIDFDNILSDDAITPDDAVALNKIITANHTLIPLYSGSKIIAINKNVSSVLFFDDFGKADFAFAKKSG